jgi:hypothetical protein
LPVPGAGMTERRRVGGAVVSLTALLGIGLAVQPLSTERLLSIYVLLLAAIALAAITRVAHPAGRQPLSSGFEGALAARSERPLRPPELVRTERELTLGMATAGHAQRRLLPLLRDAAAARLAVGHGVELGRQPDSARALLGDEVWELLRPDRPEPVDRNAPGLSFARVEAVVAKLESL